MVALWHGDSAGEGTLFCINSM